MPDVLITGLPRSGLTLVSALIDSIPGAVSLNSPHVQFVQALKLRQTIPFCKWLAGDFIWARSRLATQDAVNDYRAPDGSHLLDNEKDPGITLDEKGERKLTSLIRPGLTGDFLLAMKHDALYTSVLPTLLEMDHFRVIAVIRNPYDVIRSWQSFNQNPLSEGKLPFARAYWPEAALIDPDKPIDVLDRMIQIYEMFIQRYHENRSKVAILRYEDVIDNPAIVSNLFGIAEAPPAASRIVRLPSMRDQEFQQKLRDRFRKLGVYTRNYYSEY
jgi:hypothetical protein